ncbi:MAG: hypothetical protein KDC43_21195, partial [Saprospiraceae bacterium]|nr:hypothetical protein [Saprospiraceae bacterium]
MKQLLLFLIAVATFTSCVSNKKFEAMQAGMQSELDEANRQLGKCGEDLPGYMDKLAACERDRALLKNTDQAREQQVQDLKDHVA